MDQSSPLDFALFLNEKLKAKGFTLKKLSDVSGVPMKHLQNLTEGRLADLPAAPYLRGYLNSIGAALGFDGTEAWEHIKRAQAITSAGKRDELPKNRFARKSHTTTAAVGVLALMVIGYLGFRFSHIFGRPILQVTNPSSDFMQVGHADFIAHGMIENGDTVLVNGEEVMIGAGGTWEKRLLLQPGLNTVDIVARKFLGGETRMTRQIIYEEPISPESAPPFEQGDSVHLQKLDRSA